jgi:hypothetical protein
MQYVLSVIFADLLFLRFKEYLQNPYVILKLFLCTT